MGRYLTSQNTVALFAAATLGSVALAVLTCGPVLADPVAVTPVQIPSFADLTEQVAPAVVTVRVRMAPAKSVSAEDAAPGNGQNGPGGGAGASPIPPQTRGGVSLGSGFFISADGYVVTNDHVVEDGVNYTVITADGTNYDAKVIGTDTKTDLALLKVEASTPFAYLKWADETPRVGDWVLAIGNPFGLDGTVTLGIVSARDRNIGSGPYDDFLQIDAPINRGNSGGPTFNTKGEVVGINTAIFSPTSSAGSVGIAFDIPASTASAIISGLKDHGTVVRGWLGVQTQTVTPTIGLALKLPQAKGALVALPQAGSPADMAGIEAGDVILAVDGKTIGDPRDLALAISNNSPNRSVDLSVWRNGAAQDVTVTLGTLPPDQPAVIPASSNGNDGTTPAQPKRTTPTDAGTAIPDLGLSVASADGEPGVDVVAVMPNGPAEAVGFSIGDVILLIAGSKVGSASDVENAIDQAKAGGSKAILLQVQSGLGTAFVAIPIG